MRYPLVMRGHPKLERGFGDGLWIDAEDPDVFDRLGIPCDDEVRAARDDRMLLPSVLADYAAHQASLRARPDLLVDLYQTDWLQREAEADNRRTSGTAA